MDPDEDLPVFPVRNGVLFPGMLAPFDLGRPTSRAALEQATTAPSFMLVLAQRDPDTEEPLQA